MKTSKILNEFFLYARGWTLYSLKNINEKDILTQLRNNKDKLNSYLWFSGHILWTEEMLIANPLGKKRRFSGIKLSDFAINTKSEDVVKYKKQYKDIINYLETSKEKMSELIRSVKDSEWNKSWEGKYSKYFPTRLHAIKHCILHEAAHAGQIWINEKSI